MPPRPPTVRVTRQPDGYHWRLRSAGGHELAGSLRGYSTAEQAMKAFGRAREGMVGAQAQRQTPPGEGRRRILLPGVPDELVGL